MADISSIASVQSNHEKYAHMFENSDGNDMISTDTFFNLLMAEMSNQDPLEPMSNTEFVSQMAQFTALQAQKDNLKYSMSNYAATLIGKTLTMNAQNDDGSLISGVCSGVSISGSDVTVTVNGKSYNLSAVKAVGETPQKEQPTDINAASAFIGKEVVVQVTDEEGNPYYDQGVVESVEIQDGNAMIVIGGYLYGVDEIILVKDAATSGDTQADASDTEQNDEEVINELLNIVGQ